MIHIHSHTPLDQLQFRKAEHKATQIKFSIMQQDFAVETRYGTMTGRAGDVLAIGMDGDPEYLPMWVLSRADLHRNYAEQG